MKVKIISDSTCDLSKELIEKFDIQIIPLYVKLGDKTIKDGVEVTPDDIYSYVEAKGELPTTSAPNLDDFTSVFGEWTSKGYAVVHINISGDFSSSYQNACVAACEVGNVYVVDSRNLSTGQGLVVLHAAALARDGASPEAIKQSCDDLVSRVEASFVVDSIDYLYKGGRCSAVAALGANLLKLKPCIEVIDGKMTSSKKYRGSIEKVIMNYVTDRLSNRDDIVFERIFITHTKIDPKTVKEVEKLIKKLCPQFENITETVAGCTVTSHCGPKTLGVLFIRK